MRIEPARSSPPLLEGYRRLAGRIRYDRGGWRAEQLWFDLPELAARSPALGNGWLVALLPLAFHLGEPLHIEAEVDPVLLENAIRLQELWARWYPGRRPVPITAGIRRTESDASAGSRSLLFSGGVDSFFSLFEYDGQARASGGQPLDDLIHVWGYDLPLSNRRAFERKSRRFGDVATRLGKRLLTVATNLRHTRIETLSWPIAMHGAALAAPVHLLDPVPELALLSASGPRPDSEPYGTHPAGDHLWSSRRTRFVHYGVEPLRHLKTAIVAQSDVALEHLHVCWRSESDRNCGRCLKCCLTQVALDLAGRRLQATTFDPGRYSLDVIRTLRPNSGGGYSFMEELWFEALRLGRLDIAEATDAFRQFNRQGQGPPSLSWWARTSAKWRNSVRKRRVALGRLVREWKT
jgi:hypothetical protein